MLVLFLTAHPLGAAQLRLQNELSPDHVEVPGTGAYFIPAEGLVLSKRFDGFESESRRIEVIVVNIRSGFDGIASNFTEASLKSRGVELKSRGDLFINGARAILFKALQPDGGRNWGKWILLAENGGNTLVVNGVFVSGDADAASDVEVMLKSLFLDAALFGGVASADAELPTVPDEAASVPTGAVISQDAPAKSDYAAYGSQDIIAVSLDIISAAGPDTRPVSAEPVSALDSAAPVSGDADLPAESVLSSDVPLEVVSPDVTALDYTVPPEGGSTPDDNDDDDVNASLEILYKNSVSADNDGISGDFEP
ncbi:MAG: hypothetical protein LBQ58_10890 [Synergistaceae bacterium]|nr:hypothetical protein [Synergistaceae bacterium]